MLIKNNVLAESRLIIGKEKPIEFDKQGIAEIAPELADKLLKLKGYELVDKKKKDQVVADKKENEPKETILGKGTVEVEEVETVETENQEESIDYESLSNKELKDLIKEKGEKVPSGANKAELVEILKSLDK